MRIFFEFVLLFMFLLLELLGGNVGLALLLPLYAAIYFYEVNDWSHGYGAALFAGVGLDLIYMRPLYFSPVFFMLSLIAAHWVSKIMQRNLPFGPLATGAVAGGCGCIGNHLGAALCGQLFRPSDFVVQLGAAILFGAIFMLLLVVILDQFGSLTGMDRYGDVLAPKEKKVIRPKKGRKS